MHLRLSNLPQVEPRGAAAVPLAPRDAALLAWLAVQGPTSRDRLAAMLWPGSSETQAHTALRQRLFRLKKQLGRDVAFGSPLLQLTPGISHDLADAGEILGSLALPDAPELEAWLRQERERRLSREQDALASQAQSLEDAGNAGAALVVAKALLRLEPLSEAAHQRVMRLHYLLGDRAAALAAFDACEQVLKDEVGTRPSAQTLALLSTIEAAREVSAPRLLRAVPASVLRPPRMVGRDRALSRLEQAWAAGHVAVVTGEAGMGKSRLLQCFMQRTPGLVRAAGRHGDAGVPLATLARLLRAVNDEAPPAAAALAPEARLELSRVLPELGGTPTRHGEGQRLQLRRALVAFLRGSGSAGLVLDDLHFADAASVEMLQSVLEADGDDGAAPLRWVVAFRPAEAGPSLLGLQQALQDTARLAPVPVAPLDAAALAELVDDLALPGVVGSALAPMLLQRTGGNPLFVLETLKQAWVEQRLEQLSLGKAQLRPVSVGQLIEARVAKLSPAALALARVASIAGVDFQIALAEQVLGTGALQFADALNELESAHVLKGTQFAHDLVFDAVLRSVPQAIAVHVHGQTAAWLERHEGEPARVARHWIDALQPRRALPWLEQAATRARNALRNVEQLAFLDLRADIEAALGLRDAEFETRIIATRVHTQAARGADESYGRCDALDRLAWDPRRRIQALLARAELAAVRHDADIAEAMSRRALAAAQELDDTELVRMSQIQLCQSLMSLTSRPEEAFSLGQACLEWIDDQVDERLQCEFYASLGGLYTNSGLLSTGWAHAERARQLAESLRNVADRAITTNILALNREYSGHLDDARSLLLEARQISLLTDDAESGSGVVCLGLIHACTLLGRYADALHWSAEAERMLQEAFPIFLPMAGMHTARCWLHLGQHARALQLTERFGTPPRTAFSARVRHQLLLYALSREQGQPHLPYLESARALSQDLGVRNLRETVLIECACALPPAHALEALAQARERALRYEYGGHVLETHLRAARLATPLDPTLAREHALRALELAREVSLTESYRGELWLHCARALLAARDEAQGLATLAQGEQWVLATAREHLPEEFRDSFLHRNACNAALLAMASRARGGQPAQAIAWP
jgi:DNA-binding SARP family transcriptional activator